jgi:hypothetical protein
MYRWRFTAFFAARNALIASSTFMSGGKWTTELTAASAAGEIDTRTNVFGFVSLLIGCPLVQEVSVE